MIRWSLADGGDPYAIAAAAVARYRQAPLEGLPPFAGGAVGFFGYDLVRTVEPLGPANPDPLGLPDMALMLSDVLVVFDHLKHTVDDPRERLRRGRRPRGVLRAGRRDDRRGARARLPARCRAPAPRCRVRPLPDFASNMTREQFEAMVARIIEYIYAGDAFQVVPSQRWSAPVEVDAFSIYRGLRDRQPEPLHVLPRLRRLPVRGREPRAADHRHRPTGHDAAGRRERGRAARRADEDARSRPNCSPTPRRCAEHMMLVDLGRNDLGRVCEYGSVARRGAEGRSSATAT